MVIGGTVLEDFTSMDSDRLDLVRSVLGNIASMDFVLF